MRPLRRRLAAGLSGLMLLATAGIATAQTLSAEVDALVRARRDAAQAQARAAALEAQARGAIDAAAAARAEEARVGARILAAEANIALAEARIRLVATLRSEQRARLAAKQVPIVRLAAGLQTMARRPPVLALVQRGSIRDLVHVRAVLAGQLPVIRARTEALRRDVAEGLRLQAQADGAAATLRNGQRELRVQRVALARLEARHRASAQGFTDSAMLEQDRATALGEQARDIVDLMGRLGRQAYTGHQLASLPGPLPRPPIPGFAADAKLPAVEGPAYRLPVAGTLATGFGEVSEAGVRARGLTLLPRPGVPVTAPSAGRVVYAGSFRDYGRIVIIDHGDGWTSLIANLAALSVKAGDRVGMAGTIGRAAATQPRVTVELRHDGQPVNIVPFLNAG